MEFMVVLFSDGPQKNHISCQKQLGQWSSGGGGFSSQLLINTGRNSLFCRRKWREFFFLSTARHSLDFTASCLGPRVTVSHEGEKGAFHYQAAPTWLERVLFISVRRTVCFTSIPDIPGINRNANIMLIWVFVLWLLGWISSVYYSNQQFGASHYLNFNYW